MYNIPPISFSPIKLYKDEVFVKISNIGYIDDNHYEISNYGRIFDKYTGLFIIGYIHNYDIYIDLFGDNKIYSFRIIDLMRLFFFQNDNNKSAIMIDNKTKTLFHENNIKLVDNNYKHEENVKIKNNQRIYYGENSSFVTKLNDQKVHEICKLLEEDKLSLVEIAKMFNVSKDAIFRIKNKQNWRHISCKYSLPDVLPRDQRIRGTNNITSKYNENQIRQICKLLEEHKYSNIEIANMVGVHKQLVSTIKNHRAWTHISKDYNF